MIFHKQIILTSAILVCFSLLNLESEARSFKGKYYKECYAPVLEITPLLKEKSGIGGKAETLAKAGGLFGKVGGFVGLGGVAHTVGNVANAVHTVNKYSTIISDVSAYMSQMKQDHPDDSDRLAAYGEQMTREAEDLNKVQVAIKQSQECYDTAHNELGPKVVAKELKSRKARKYLKEIQKGTKASGKKLLVMMKRMNTNIESYDKALGQESNSMGIMNALGNLAASQINKARPSHTYGSLSRFAGYHHVRPAATSHLIKAVANSVSAQAAPAQTESEQITHDMQPAMQRIGQSSQAWLDLYDDAADRVEHQKILEAKVKKKPW